jgi:hypothetical protein
MLENPPHPHRQIRHELILRNPMSGDFTRFFLPTNNRKYRISYNKKYAEYGKKINTKAQRHKENSSSHNGGK